MTDYSGRRHMVNAHEVFLMTANPAAPLPQMSAQRTKDTYFLLLFYVNLIKLLESGEINHLESGEINQ